VRRGRDAANAAVTTLCAAMTFGVRRGVRADNPSLGVRKFPEKKTDRFLAPAELARLGEVLAAAEALGVENPYALAAIRLLVLTGCRKNEILTLKRAYVDAHHKCLRLDTTAAASLLESTVGTLQTWRWMGLGPRFPKIGRRVVYAEGDVLAFKTEQAAAKEAGRLSRVQAA
jgi:integrase